MSGSRGLTVALAGSVGSGKSTVAKALARELDGTIASFGDYIRHLAVEVGEQPERSTLQRIGQERVESDPKAFVLAFLDWASPVLDKPFIVDGVRHAAVDAALRAWSLRRGNDYTLVLINTSLCKRAERRHGGDKRHLREEERHLVERETIETLPDLAEVVVDGDGQPDEVIARIMSSDPLASRLL